jgi:Domain of unknown function (DUF4386)
MSVTSWKTMDAARRTALVVGVLFIVTFVSSIAALILYKNSALKTGYIVGAGADWRVYLGALLEMILIVANIGTAVVLFPILKRQNEAGALSYVAARIIECTFIAIGIISVLTVVTLRKDASGASSLVVFGKSLVAIHDWTFLLGPGFVVGIGNGLILGYLMLRSGLVPRAMAIVGLVGGSLIILSGTAVLFGVFNKGSKAQAIATIPEFVWEGFLGIYLTFWGFKAAPILLDYPSNADAVRLASPVAVP